MTAACLPISIAGALAVIASLLISCSIVPRSGNASLAPSAAFSDLADPRDDVTSSDVTSTVIPLPNSFAVFVPSEINGTMITAMEQDLVSLGVAEMFMDLNGGASIGAPNAGLWFSEPRQMRVRERVVPVVTFWEENGADRPVLPELFSIARWLCCFLWQDALLVRLNETALLLPRPADHKCAQITHPLPRVNLALQ